MENCLSFSITKSKASHMHKNDDFCFCSSPLFEGACLLNLLYFVYLLHYIVYTIFKYILFTFNLC